MTLNIRGNFGPQIPVAILTHPPFPCGRGLSRSDTPVVIFFFLFFFVSLVVARVMATT